MPKYFLRSNSFSDSQHFYKLQHVDWQKTKFIHDGVFRKQRSSGGTQKYDEYISGLCFHFVPHENTGKTSFLVGIKLES